MPQLHAILSLALMCRLCVCTVQSVSDIVTVVITLVDFAAFPPHTTIAMPALSPTMTAGNIGVWQKKAGDEIAPGDVLVEIETDKAQMDFEMADEGILAKVLVDSGTKDVNVGTVSTLLS